jgi:transcriptional regulator with XRE-family HTH domain
MLVNLSWKIRTLGRKNYQIAAAVDMSESKFSRVLAGRADLTAGEQDRIAAALGVADRDWLFKRFNVVPRSYAVCDEPVSQQLESVAR